MTVHRFLSTIFCLQHFTCYILRYNNLIAIYNLLYLHFLNPSLKAACFLKKIRLKKFAFSIYQQFPKMMSMDFYTRQVGKPHMVTVSHELNCHVISGSPPISTGNSESNLLSTTTQQPAQQVQHVRGVSGRTRESRTAGGLFRGEVNIYIYFLERIYAQFLGVKI